MYERYLARALGSTSRSVLLLGPRQVGKSRCPAGGESAGDVPEQRRKGRGFRLALAGATLTACSTRAQQLTAGGVDRDQAEVIANAIRLGGEQDDHVTSDQFKAGIADVRTEIANLDTRLSTEVAGVRTEIANLDTRLSTEVAGVRTEIANLETRLVRWMVGTVIATATLTFGILRFIGP